MSNPVPIGEQIHAYAAKLKQFSELESPLQEDFNILAGRIQSFLADLISTKPMDFLNNLDDLQSLQSLLSSQSERFTDLTPRSPKRIEGQTEHWPTQEIKDLDAELAELEASDVEDLSESAQRLSGKINAFQSRQHPMDAITNFNLVTSLKERASALQTPAVSSEATHEEELSGTTNETEVTSSLGIEEIGDDATVEEGPSFWKKAAVLALVGLIIVAPVTAVLGPMLMGSSNQASANTTFETPRGGTRTDFSSDSISMPDLQTLNSGHNASAVIAPSTNNTNGTQPLDIHTPQPHTTPHEDRVDNGLTPVRFIDVAILRGTELVPAETDTSLYVYEYDSRNSEEFQLQTEATPLSCPMLSDGSDTIETPPTFAPSALFSQNEGFKPLNNLGIVHKNALRYLALPKSPESVETVKNLNPVGQLPLPPPALSLGSRDVCPANYTNSTV